jgi:hypothetical protein
MAPDAKSLDLLYVSDYETNDVYAYSYPAGKLRGVLAGVLANFVLPSGLCADGAGDVFVPDSYDASVLEYAHGSTRLVAKLLDPNELPYSCAVDPTSGDLAVVDLESDSGGGGISIYAHARGRPKELGYGFVYFYYFAAYDATGDLFVDASYDVPSEPFAFLEVPKGSKNLMSLTLDQSVGVAGGVSWDRKDVLVGDSRAGVIYRFAIDGSVGRKVGSTRLRDARDPTQFLVAGNDLVAANFAGAGVSFWKYPAGGAPLANISGLGEPFGVTLSRANASDVLARPGEITVRR